MPCRLVAGMLGRPERFQFVCHHCNIMESTFLNPILLLTCTGCDMILGDANVASGGCIRTVLGRYEGVEAHRSKVERSFDQSGSGGGDLNVGVVRSYICKQGSWRCPQMYHMPPARQVGNCSGLDAPRPHHGLRMTRGSSVRQLMVWRKAA
jgi:hypothetical protein